MAKRFTDTDKWKREWFYELEPKAKLAWLYLLDQCDHCGIWPRNFKLASEQLGFKIDHATLIEWFGTKVVNFDSDKYFIAAFFDFQYANCKEGFKAKQSALNTLIRLGLVDDSGNCIERSPNPSGQSMDCTSIGISIGIGIGKEGECEGKQDPGTLNPRALVEIWNADRGPLPECKQLTETRKAKAKAQLANFPDVAYWRSIISRWKASKFCVEQWRPSFDELLTESKRVSTLEGKYDNRTTGNSSLKSGETADQLAARLLEAHRNREVSA